MREGAYAPAVVVPLTGRKIFLASPGGLDGERDLIDREVDSFNRLYAYDQGVAFIVVRWERLPGGLGRPQARINPHIVRCDFMLMLVGDRLGSATTPTPPYLTGIEEELAVAATACAEIDSPMVDIALLFRSPSESDLLHPSDELRQVQQFQNEIEATKEIICLRFASDDELRTRLATQLTEWARTDLEKAPLQYPRLVAALARDTRTPMASPPSDQPGELVAWAEAQADEGLITVADSAFAKAATHRVPEHLLRYARFLQRTGQLERAFEFDQRVLSLPSVVSSDSPEAAGYRSRALATMGLIRRKQGRLEEARSQLVDAVEQGRAAGDRETEHLAYALDQLGLTEARRGHLLAASAAYDEALERRRQQGDRAGEAQSLVNLARVARQEGDNALAIARLEEAVGLLAADENERALANALATLGELLVDVDLARARTVLERALEINERLKVHDGISVVNNGLALVSLAEQNFPAALGYAQRVLDLSNASGNRDGIAVGLRIMGQAQSAAGRWVDAIGTLEQAVTMATDHGDVGRAGAARLRLAEAYQGSGQTEAAREAASAALEEATAAGDRRTESAARELLDRLAG